MHKENQRTREEILFDKILLLYLFVESSKNGRLESVLKAQKLAFLSAVSLFEKRDKAFSLEFYRWKLGPMSNAVYSSLDCFNQIGYIEKSDHRLKQPSTEAIELMDAFAADVLSLKDNRFVMNAIVPIARQYGEFAPIPLKEKVYKMKFATVDSPIKISVADTPKCKQYTQALEPYEAKRILEIPVEWQDTFEILLTPHFKESIEKGERELRGEYSHAPASA